MDLSCPNINTDNSPVQIPGNTQDLKRAEELFNTGSQNKAVIVLERIVARNRQNQAAKKCLSRAYYMMASDLNESSKGSPAQQNKVILFMKKSIQHDSKNADAFLLLGQVYERIGQEYGDKRQKGLVKLNYEKGLAAYLSADQLDPKGKAALSLARVYALLEKPDLAWQCLERYLVNYPQNLGETVFVLKRISEARPGDSNARKLLAGAYQNNRQTELAIQEFKKVIELEPKDAENYFNLGLIYFSKKEYDLALASIEKAIGLYPKEPKYKKYVSEICYAKAYAIYESFSVGKNSWNKMLELVKEAIKNDPGNFNAYKLLGYIYEEIANVWNARGEKEKAKNYYEKAQEAYLKSYQCLKIYLENNPKDIKATELLKIVKEKLKIKGETK